MTQEAKSEATPPKEEQGQHAPQTTPPDTGQGNDFEKVTGGQAEYTQKMQEYSRAKQLATDAGFDSVTEYIESMENKVFVDSMIDAPEKKQKVVSDEPKKEEKPASDPILERLERMEQQQLQRDRERAIEKLHVQWDSYQSAQNKLDEGSRFGYTRDQLQQFLSNPRYNAIVVEIANKEMTRGIQPNVWEIAADMMSLKTSRANVRREGAETQAILEKEKVGTNLKSGSAPPPPDKKTEKNPAQVYVDRIIPSDRKTF